MKGSHCLYTSHTEKEGPTHMCFDATWGYGPREAQRRLLGGDGLQAEGLGATVAVAGSGTLKAGWKKGHFF